MTNTNEPLCDCICSRLAARHFTTYHTINKYNTLLFEFDFIWTCVGRGEFHILFAQNFITHCERFSMLWILRIWNTRTHAHIKHMPFYGFSSGLASSMIVLVVFRMNWNFVFCHIDLNFTNGKHETHTHTHEQNTRKKKLWRNLGQRSISRYVCGRDLAL